MNRLIVAVSVAVALLGASAPALASGGKLGGTWVIDVGKSSGVRPEIKGIVLTIAQSGDRIELVDKIATSEGERTIQDAYDVSGKETEFTPEIIARFNGEAPRNVAVGKGKRTASWTGDGNGFDLVEEVTVEDPFGGTTPVKTTRKWRLSEDGRTLTIEMVVDQGPPQMGGWKHVYTRS